MGEIVSHKCTFDSRVPEDQKVQKIKDWPACTTVTEVRGFLGTNSVLRIFIKGYSMIARLLICLTCKNAIFKFGKEKLEAMKKMKQVIMNSPALMAIDYESKRAIILQVDSSVIGVSWILGQEHKDSKRRINHFESINWNDVQARYSQAKIELFGLFRAMRAVRLHLYTIRNLVVEVDAKYIKGMLNNPNLQPSATINRWIAAILLFSFMLKHILGNNFLPDGLSRHPRALEDAEEEDNFEEWIDDACRLYIADAFAEFEDPTATPTIFEQDEQAELAEQKLREVKSFLKNAKLPVDVRLSPGQMHSTIRERKLKAFIRYAVQFFLRNQ